MESEASAPPRRSARHPSSSEEGSFRFAAPLLIQEGWRVERRGGWRKRWGWLPGHVIAVQGLVEDGFQQAAAFGLGGRELLFQPVAEGHQFVHLGDDAVLFG